MVQAAALNTPGIALFGPSWVTRWRPYSEYFSLIWAGDYGDLPHPDSIDVNTDERYLNVIPVETVWQAITEKLALENAPKRPI